MRRTRYIDTLGNPYQTGGERVVAPDGLTSYADLERAIDKQMTALVAGRTGTAGTMELFSAHNHVAGTYTRNASLWCKDLVSQLTGCCVGAEIADGTWLEQRLGVMITDQHMLQSAHGKIDPSYSGRPTVFRCVDASGTKVDMTGLSESYDAGLTNNDLVVTLLSAAVPAGIHKMPVIVIDRLSWHPIIGGLAVEYLGETPIVVDYGPATGPCALGISQGTDGITGQKMMAYTCFTKAEAADTYITPSALVLSHVYYTDSGDSGLPRTYLVDGSLSLCRLSGSGTIFDAADFIDSLIVRADAAAGISTGLTVTRYTPTIIS